VSQGSRDFNSDGCGPAVVLLGRAVARSTDTGESLKERATTSAATWRGVFPLPFPPAAIASAAIAAKSGAGFVAPVRDGRHTA
jgi:hypothetical protein